jgi:importin-9
LNDARLAQISVKGDLIINADDGRIKTRSRAKQSMPPPRDLGCDFSSSCLLERLYQQYAGEEDAHTNSTSQILDPDQYTMVPAPLKIVKLLIDELLSASGANAAANAAAAAISNADFDYDDDEEGWEDDNDTLDLGIAATKNDLMSFMEGPGLRQPDDETQTFLTEFFIQCGRENVANFQEWYNMLSGEEKVKLNELASSAGRE